MAQQLMQAVRAHVGATPQDDDITGVFIRRRVVAAGTLVPRAHTVLPVSALQVEPLRATLQRIAHAQ